VGERASRVGFDWERADQVWDKIEEEKKELLHAIEASDKKGIKQEIGDMIFSMANLSRLLGINPEEALKDTVDRFIKRFHAMEKHFKESGKELNSCDMAEMDEVWEKIKKEINFR
jgi:tetrapyrrole methylase family protein/MazG family protein/ATP diphosphatase